MSNPAEGYENYMVPALFRPWAITLVELAAPRPGERVLDVGCGTGIVARQVASKPGFEAAVTGLDSSAAMLAIAQASAAREGVTVDWHEGRAESLPFPAHSFDLVLSQFALMFFVDKVAALAEMRRVRTPGGRVVASMWQGLDRHPFYRTLHEVIQQRLGVSALQDIFCLGSTDQVRTLARSAGFEQVQVSPISMTARFPDPEGFLAGEIAVDTAAIPALQHLDAQDRAAMVAAISRDMAAPLEAVTRDKHVVIEFHANVLHATG